MALSYCLAFSIVLDDSTLADTLVSEISTDAANYSAETFSVPVTKSADSDGINFSVFGTYFFFNDADRSSFYSDIQNRLAEVQFSGHIVSSCFRGHLHIAGSLTECKEEVYP